MDGFPLFPDEASSHAAQVDLLFFFMLALSLFFTVLVAAAILYFGTKYRRRHPDEIPPQTTAHSRIEIFAMVGLLALSMVAFFWGAGLYLAAAKPVDAATEIYVIGKKWMWKFEYPDGQATINELYVPVGEPVRLTMTSQDVIHSFFVPAFRAKQDVVPGRYTTFNFVPTKTGEYHLFCAEYCGLNHSRMIGTVYVLEPADYEAWLAGSTSTGQTQDPAAAGEAAFGSLGCAGCHLPSGGGPGPSLVGIFGEETQLTDGTTALVDATYLRRSILRPNDQVVAGYQPIMPTYEGQVSEEQIIQLIAYIRSLGDGASDGNSGMPDGGAPAGDSTPAATTEISTTPDATNPMTTPAASPGVAPTPTP